MRASEGVAGEPSRYDPASSKDHSSLPHTVCGKEEPSRTSILRCRLLLGLMDGGTAAEVLLKAGLRRSKLRAAVEFVVSPRNLVLGEEYRLDASARRVIELAVDEVNRWKDRYVETEHSSDVAG